MNCSALEFPISKGLPIITTKIHCMQTSRSIEVPKCKKLQNQGKGRKGKGSRKTSITAKRLVPAFAILRPLKKKVELQNHLQKKHQSHDQLSSTLCWFIYQTMSLFSRACKRESNAIDSMQVKEDYDLLIAIAEAHVRSFPM